MQILGEASEDDMVRAFVLAEIESPRFALGYRRGLAQVGAVDHSPASLAPWLMAPEQEVIRRHLLQQCRGYASDRMLFRGFPHPVNWQWCECTRDGFGALMYARFPDWLDLSQGSRRVSDGARRVATGQTSVLSAHVWAVVHRLSTGWRPPPIVVVLDRDGQGVIVEGHTRATAYAMGAADVAYPVLLGSSVDMHRWAHL